MQLNLFDIGKEPFKITKPVRLIELFAGIGSQAKSLKNLGVDFEPYIVCEFDQHAIDSYNAVHHTNFEVSDITELKGEDLKIVDKDKYQYILTYSFPCQDLSLAGKQNGMTKGSGTRSGLLWEVERLLNETEELPDVLLMENVPQVHSEENREDFRKWISFLESKGYNCYYQDLNAKDYGIPQNRNRTFMVSLLGDYTYEFPQPIELKLRLKDMLEDKVDEKYYIVSEKANELCERLYQEELSNNESITVSVKNLGSSDKERVPECEEIDVGHTILSRDYKGFSNYGSNAIVELGNYRPSGHSATRVVSGGYCTNRNGESWSSNGSC